MTAAILADLALTILEKMIPQIEAGVKSGQIPAEYQVQLMARVKNLRPENGGFKGPEWEPSGTPTPNLPVDPTKDVPPASNVP